MPHSTLKDIEILFGLALVTVILFQRWRFPTIIGFLFAGILAGPHAFALIADTHQVEQMAEFGVVLLLFTIGIEFSLKELVRIRRLVFLGGGLQVGVTIFAVFAIAGLLGYPPSQAVFFGFLVALSSTAILIKLLLDKGEIDSAHGRAALGVLIFQDLCVVPLMLFTPFLAGRGSGFVDLVLVCLKAAAVVLIAHNSARFLVPWIFGQVVRTRSRELFILTILFIGLGTAWLTALAGLSLALGAFIAGLAISESEYSHRAMGDIIPFRDAFMSLFFISVGMLLDPQVVIGSPLAIVLLIAAILLLKGGLAAAAVALLGVPLRIALIAGFSLAQIGEFSFILAQSGLQHQLLDPHQYQIFLAASIGTMALTPFCLRYGPTLAENLTALAPQSLRMRSASGAEGAEKIAAGLENHVVVVGFGINGQNLVRILKHLAIPHVIIESNPFSANGEKKEEEAIFYGDATQPEVLEHARIQQARILVIAISDPAATRRLAALAREMHPGIHIIVRTRYVLEVDPLLAIGVNEVIPEEFETSIEILSRVLRTLLIPHDEIAGCIAEVRRGGYDLLRTLSPRSSAAAVIPGYLAGAGLATFRIAAGAPLAGESLSQGTIRARSGATVLVIKRGETVVSNPDPVWELQAGDILLLLGSSEQLTFAERLFAAPVAD